MIPINILIILNYCRDLKKLVIIISVNSFVYDDTDYFNRVPLRFLVLISFMQLDSTVEVQYNRTQRLTILPH